jgi:hypothetical protein
MLRPRGQSPRARSTRRPGTTHVLGQIRLEPAEQSVTGADHALHRAELRDASRVTELGGTPVLEAARRAGRIYQTLDDLIAAGYDPHTRGRTAAAD